MVIERTLFECPLCHTQYKAKGDAEQCEKAHLKVKSIASDRLHEPKYHAWRNGNAEYPDYVWVKFETGMAVRYVRG